MGTSLRFNPCCEPATLKIFLRPSEPRPRGRFLTELFGRDVLVADKKDEDEVARLERLNAELGDSLRRCRKLLHDYESRLAANSNETPIDSDDEQQEASPLIRS